MPKYENNLVVIGAGSGGLVSSYIAAAVNAKVTLIEKHKMGGDCLNTGCVPSKAIIRTARLIKNIKQVEKYGLVAADYKVDFTRVMGRVHEIISKIEPHDSVERYQSLGVNVIQGKANIISEHEVEVNGEIITTKGIIVASGGVPFIPPIEGIENVDYLTSENLWEITRLPEKLVIIGSGPIGCEMAQTFARLGSEVFQFERGPRILEREDQDVSQFTMGEFRKDGVNLILNAVGKKIISDDGKNYLEYEQQGYIKRQEFDRILLAVGRKANVEGFGLDKLGVRLRENQTIAADEFLRTNIPNIYVVGDVTGPFQFTHTASHQAWYAVVNSLFGKFKKFKVDYRVIPKVTFTDPEIATVGLNEVEAKANNIKYEVSAYGLGDLDRAITESADKGWVKILTVPGKDKILGASIVGDHAGELIVEFVLAMKHNLGLNKILGTIHAYPTWAEANKFAAGVWKKAHAPEGILKFLENFHKWMR